MIITISAVIYQRKTGPTYPKEIKTEINGKLYDFKLPRSATSTSNCLIEIPVFDKSIRGFVIFRKYPTMNNWDTLSLETSEYGLKAELPSQLPAGKLEYFFVFKTGNKNFAVLQEKPVVIRYKGEVPALVLIPHVIFMFFSMFLSNVAGLMSAFKISRARLYLFITFFGMLVGGMILGPVVQKYAFNEFWTGVPFGWDLTDNKTLIAFIAWCIAFFTNLRKFRPGYIIFAAIITLIIFSIPHSMFGSELNHATGEVTTG